METLPILSSQASSMVLGQSSPKSLPMHKQIQDAHTQTSLHEKPYLHRCKVTCLKEHFYRQAKMSVRQKLFYVYPKNDHENPAGSLSQACHRTVLSYKASSQDGMAHSGFYLGHDF